MCDSDNPYLAPIARSSTFSGVPSLRGTVSCLLWYALAGGIWFGRSQMVPIYEDFDVRLPLVTRFVIHPLSPLVLAIIGCGFLMVTTMARTQKYHRRIQIISIVATIGLAAVAAFGFFLPLVVMIESLN